MRPATWSLSNLENPTPPLFLTNWLKLSRRSVDPWVEENIVTMLQLGAIKKIHRDFFFRVLILARMEEGKDYGKRFILDLKTMIQISHQKILKNQRTKVSSWSSKIVYTKRPESYWKPSCVYILYKSVWKRMPRTSRLMQQWGDWYYRLSQERPNPVAQNW